MWANSTLAFLFSSFTFLSPDPKPIDIITSVTHGKLEGTSSLSRNGRTVYEFVGINYVRPPIGELRFKPPVAWNESWEGVKDAKVYGPRCIQYHLIARFLTGAENCLHLNIYSHRFRQVDEDPINETDLKPVMVYVHGGLWMQGSSDFYKPSYFMSEDIVFVTMNYRIGALGFLSLENSDIPGNAGLKDQVAGLKWVQREIRNFGGDPTKVTIHGNSAGSAAVHYHLLSPMSKGLFRGAISQSGTSLVMWGSTDRPYEQAKHFAKMLNCTSEDKSELAKCLRSIDAKTIGNMQRGAANILHDRYALFGPTIEYNGDNNTEEVFISQKPEDIIKSGNFSKVPWIVGANSEEGLIYAAPIVRNDTIREALNANWTYWAPILFRFEDEPNKVEIANSIREYYNLTSEIGMDTLANLTMFLTDRVFLEGLHNTLNLHRGQHPIYPYIYTYRGVFSFGKLVLGMTFNLPIMADVFVSTSWNWISTNVLRKKSQDYGVSHGDELPLMFKLPFQKTQSKKSKDFEMSENLIKMWTHFATHGVPPEIQGITWPSLSKKEDNLNSPMTFLKFDKEFELVDDPFDARAEFWESLNLLPYKIERPVNSSSDNESAENEIEI